VITAIFSTPEKTTSDRDETLNKKMDDFTVGQQGRGTAKRYKACIGGAGAAGAAGAEAM